MKAGPNKGLQDKANSSRLLCRRRRRHLFDLCPQGRHCQCHRHPAGPGKFSKDFFVRKAPILASQDWFLQWDNVTVHNTPIFQNFLREKDVRAITQPPYSANLILANVFLSEVDPGWTFLVPGQLQEELGWGGPHCQQRWLRRRRPAVGRAILKVYSHQRWIGLKKVLNKFFPIINRFVVIPPCAFVSKHTTYLSDLL
jgi:hypothetical protein